jgi:hypothetical protein
MGPTFMAAGDGDVVSDARRSLARPGRGSGMLVNLSGGLVQAFRVFFLLFLCRVLLPRPWMSVVAFVGAMGLLTGAITESWWSETHWIEGVSLVFIYVLLTLIVIVRSGSSLLPSGVGTVAWSKPGW